MTKQMPGPDVRQLATEKLPQIDFPGGKEQSFRIFFQPEAHREVWKHAQEDTSVEICGVLVGQWGRDGDGPFALVSASIRGEAAANKFAEVTFTHETWSKINAEMDGRYADRAIVGWYHTHPDFGIFLSDRDLFIQEHFFSSPGQVAMVVDPVRNIEGIFVWRDGKTKLADHYWIGNRIQVGVPGEQGAGEKRDGTTDSASRATSPATVAAPPGLPFAWATPVQYLLVFLIGYLLAGRVNDWMLRRTALEAQVASYDQYCLRPDLDKRLGEIRKELATLEEGSQNLEKDHLEWLGKSSTEDKADLVRKREEAWDQLRAVLSDSKRRLELVEHDYCLLPEQRALLDDLRARRKLETEERLAKEQEEAKAKSDAAKSAEQGKPTREEPGKKEATKGEPAKAAVPESKPTTPESKSATPESKPAAIEKKSDK